MPIEKIKMPQLGESVTEGKITKWFVAVGDKVNQYDLLAEVMTDKVTAEIPSLFTGVIKELVANVEETFAVGEVICTLETADMFSNTVQDGLRTENLDGVIQTERSDRKPQSISIVPDQREKVRYSPAVLKLSQEHQIDLTQIIGTGSGGRITRKDVLQAMALGEKPKTNVTEAETVKVKLNDPIAASVQTPLSAENELVCQGDIEIPLDGVRKAIASNMLKSKHEIPHAWMMIEVDVTNLVDYRNSIKEEFNKKEGFNLTFFAFFVKAVAQSLKEYPQLNSMWAGDKIVQKKEINLSIAVATDDALFVPVIKQADEKTIKGIAREISELADRARNGRLTADDTKGGTFTVNNTGTFGSVQSMGIINYPQAAILQMESIVKRPVVMNNGMIAVRDMVNLCLSLDHRVLDGLICGKFLQKVKDILEKISKENTSVY